MGLRARKWNFNRQFQPPGVSRYLGFLWNSSGMKEYFGDAFVRIYTLLKWGETLYEKSYIHRDSSLTTKLPFPLKTEEGNELLGLFYWIKLLYLIYLVVRPIPILIYLTVIRKDIPYRNQKGWRLASRMNNIRKGQKNTVAQDVCNSHQLHLAQNVYFLYLASCCHIRLAI